MVYVSVADETEYQRESLLFLPAPVKIIERRLFKRNKRDRIKNCSIEMGDRKQTRNNILQQAQSFWGEPSFGMHDLLWFNLDNKPHSMLL